MAISDQYSCCKKDIKVLKQTSNYASEGGTTQYQEEKNVCIYQCVILFMIEKPASKPPVLYKTLNKDSLLM